MKVVAYADDISLIHFVDKGAVSTLHCDVDRLENWCSLNHMTVNASKTQLMYMSRSTATPIAAAFMINGQTIQRADCLDILGVTFSSNLKWDDFFPPLYAKLCRANSLTVKLHRMGASKKSIATCFYGLVFPLIAYCWPAICDLPTRHLRKLHSLDKHASRLLSRPSCFMARLDGICDRLIKRIAADSDSCPLAEFFDTGADSIRRSRRNTRVLLPLPIKHSFYRNSFIRYCM